METITCEEIIKKRAPKGRPRIHENYNNITYQREYYQKNKSRWQGDELCKGCGCYYSKSNKTRHMRSKYHIDNLAVCVSDDV